MLRTALDSKSFGTIVPFSPPFYVRPGSTGIFRHDRAGSHIHYRERLVQRLTEEQFEKLEEMELNDRFAIVGPAGIGKTYLALARRWGAAQSTCAEGVLPPWRATKAGGCGSKARTRCPRRS